MATYRIRVLEPASRQLARLDRSLAQRIVAHVRRLAADPQAMKLEPLTGELTGLFKARVGDYRVIYELLHDEHLLIIHAIGHRRDIYRKR